jgi:CheY-like chemotaxis protein
MEFNFERERPLRGMRILIADDEFLVAIAIEEAFRDAGADVVTAATLAAALKSARAGDVLSAAFLDVRLGRETTEVVADELAARAVPFAFYTGQALPDHIRRKHPDIKVLIKPSKQELFISTILDIVRH